MPFFMSLKMFDMIMVVVIGIDLMLIGALRIL
jgi:hypothetical protein